MPAPNRPARTPAERDGDAVSTTVSVEDAAKNTLLEARMVLPGIQALFGFQLIAVLNSGFEDKLSPLEQNLHLAAMGLIALAIALIMAPAAFHRASTPYVITARFVKVSSRLLGASMIVLAPAFALDFYVVARAIAGPIVGASLAIALFVVLVALWFVLPRLRGLRVGPRHERERPARD